MPPTASCSEHNYAAVKTGYVGRIIPRGEHHDGQWMVNHYVRTAAADGREPALWWTCTRPCGPPACTAPTPTGWPTRPPGATSSTPGAPATRPSTKPFCPSPASWAARWTTRPASSRSSSNAWNPARNKGRQVHTTLAKQLALYVTMYQPLQMAADLPEAYNQHLDAFQFIEDVPVDWDDTRMLRSRARRLHHHRPQGQGPRASWYVGSIYRRKRPHQQPSSSISWTPGQRTKPPSTPTARAPAGTKTRWPTRFRSSTSLANPP